MMGAQLSQPSRRFSVGLVSSYHGDGGGSNGGTDRRPRDNAAQGGAHVHRQYEAFTHRLEVLRTG